jgi:Holliday junction resolvase-like predicted endonuclease
MDLCNRGFVRFTTEHLLRRLSSVVVAPYSESTADAAAHAQRFVRTYCSYVSNRNGIDVARLEPLVPIYESAQGQCYFDFVAVSDFHRWLLVRSREWFSSQHGDRFTLAMKRAVEKRLPGVQVTKKARVTDAGGRTAEVDLLVSFDSVIYAVECKAFTKSREFWLGSPQATRKRHSRIRQAVEQACRAAEVTSRSAECNGNAVEWAVCLPTQEYLRPLDEFGLLADGIPRVCTPEEFALALQRRRDAGLAPVRRA